MVHSLVPRKMELQLLPLGQPVKNERLKLGVWGEALQGGGREGTRREREGER